MIFFYLFFQKDGTKKITSVYNSRRPAIIAKQYHHFTNSGTIEKLFEGPRFPKAGPTFPTIDKAPVNEVVKSRLPRQPKKVVIITRMRYRNINDVTLNTMSSRPGFPFNLIVKTP